MEWPHINDLLGEKLSPIKSIVERLRPAIARDEICCSHVGVLSDGVAPS